MRGKCGPRAHAGERGGAVYLSKTAFLPIKEADMVGVAFVKQGGGSQAPIPIYLLYLLQYKVRVI